MISYRNNNLVMVYPNPATAGVKLEFATISGDLLTEVISGDMSGRETGNAVYKS